MAAHTIPDLCDRVNFRGYRSLGLSIDIGRRYGRRSSTDFAIWQWSNLNGGQSGQFARDYCVTSQSNSRDGIAFALAGFVILSCGDALIKTIAGEWSPLAVAALRFTIGALGLSVILLIREGRAAFRPQSPWLQAGRGLCLAVATMCFFAAIFVMPLAEATALVFIAPIFTALLSGPLLKERVRPATWIASFIAFAGVIFVLRPNLSEIGLIALLPMGSALAFSLMMLANRAVAGQGSSLSMQVFVAAGAAPILVLCAILGSISGAERFAVSWPDWTVIARCAIVAVTASIAHWLVYLGTTRAGAATIAPTTYVQLLVAISLGWLVFGDKPDVMTMLGSAVIIAAGLFLWSTGRQKIS